MRFVRATRGGERGEAGRFYNDPSGNAMSHAALAVRCAGARARMREKATCRPAATTRAFARGRRAECIRLLPVAGLKSASAPHRMRKLPLLTCHSLPPQPHPPRERERKMPSERNESRR